MPVLLGESHVDRLLTIADSIDAVEEGFRLLGRGEAANFPRRRGVFENAILNVMWALAPPLGGMGEKVYPIVRSDVIQGSAFTFLLYGLPVGDLQAILEVNLLGQRRTGAASTVASRYVARPEGETLSIFGAGWQASSQVAAIAHALPALCQVLVVERQARFVQQLRAMTGLDVQVAEPRDAVGRADVLVTATGSAEPVFDGAWLRPGTHVNAVGSNFAGKRELDEQAIRRADVLVADSAEAARLETGDLLRNDFEWERLVELGAIAAGLAPGRSSPEEITMFESHGLALEDLACPVRVTSRA
jgi:ornithine cyclodeaminase/alanine dehydrogenase